MRFVESAESRPSMNVLSSFAHPLPTASLMDSGSSFLLVSGSRKQRVPKKNVRLP